MDFVKQGVFYLLFMQLGIMITLATWNAREVNSLVVNRLFGGLYTDFNREWFADVGYIIQRTMFYNAFWPMIEVLLSGAVRFAYRMLD